tara:strand:- start:154 stop:705 length:552 start_codon:yes stop_codon:yes gene_type:complete
MKKNITLLSVLFFLLTSCRDSDIGFITAQPNSLEEIDVIPNNFQGKFVLDGYNDTITITEKTIDGININTDSLIVKSQGNYLFVNMKKRDYYSLFAAQVVKSYNFEKISLHEFFIQNIVKGDYISMVDSISEKEINDLIIKDNNLNISKYDSLSEQFIIDKLSVNQFQMLLNNSQITDVKRLY